MAGRPSLALLLAAALAAISLTAAAQPVSVVGAELGLELNRHLLADLGLEPRFRRPVGRSGEVTRAVFATAPGPTLELRAPGGSFAALGAGALPFTGGFELLWEGGRLDLAEFELVPARGGALFELRAADGSAAFVLASPHPLHLAESGEFLFLNMDLLLGGALAGSLGRPRLAGTAAGSADLRLRLAGPLPDGAVCTADTSGDVDLRLTGISNLIEAAHDETRVAMAPAVDLLNLGPADVEWYRPIAPDGGAGAIVGPHPFLVMNLYRLADGVLRQIGRADAKHAFFAANDDCPCAAAQILFAGCADEYSAATNYNRTNLGPRREVDAFSGSYSPQGSHFDGLPVDGLRDHYGTDHADPFTHRLTARTADLVTPGAEYFVEAWYIASGDVDIFNSMGHRGVAPQLAGAWIFPFTDSGLTQGPALDRWVDRAAPGPHEAATLLDTGEGRLELVATARPLPSGAWRYDYGLMNFDFDRQVRSFSVPLPPGVEPANAAFHDADGDPDNDWQAAAGTGEIVWSTRADFPSLGALDWGTLINFGFDAGAPPAAPAATLGVLESGSPAALAAATHGPGAELAAVRRLAVDPGGSGGGTVTSTPPGIGCGGDCDELYPAGTAVDLAAAAEPGSALIRWREGGAVLGTAATQEIVLDTSRDLEAVFELCERRLAEHTVEGDETFEACRTLTAGAGFEVAAGGRATLRAGERVALENGFATLAGGQAAIELDPALLP